MQRLNEQDALLAYGEATGWPLHLASLQVYDVSSSSEGLDLERVRDLYRQRLPLIPTFRHRLVRVPGGLDRPVWVEDPDIDVASHIHGVRLPAPGSDLQLAQLVGRLIAPLLDPIGPLWEVWVIEGLQHGRVAILARLHHAAGDGLRGLAVQAATYDVDPTAPFSRNGAVPSAGEAVPGTLRLLGGAALHIAGTPLRLARTAGHLARATAHLAGVVRRGEDGALVLPLTAPRTSLNRRISTRRGFAFCSLPLTPVKEAARREGVKFNDVVLALVSGALRRYLDARGELPARSLVAAVPVGLPDDGASGPVGGNHWAVVLASLASTTADPVERLHRISASARTGKDAQQALGSDLWHELFDVPPLVWDVIARGYVGLHLADAHPAVVNVAVSNLRGAPFPLYFAGARLVANYPMGPIADGLGLNVTVISYLDSLDVGLTVCPDLVEDPWLLVDAFRTEVDELARRYPEQGAPARPR